MVSVAQEARRRTARAQVALAAVAIVAALRGPAHAEEPELTLRWSASAECPDAAWAAQRLRERLGRAPDRPSQGAPLEVDAALSRRDERFVLMLHTTLGAAESDRQLEAPVCAELAEAAVLMIALAIDPEAVARAEAAEPEAAHDDERPPALIPEPPPPPRPRGFPWALGAALLGSRGDQPGWGGGGLLFAAFQAALFRAELAGFWLVPRAGSEAPAAGRVRVSLWALRPTLCVTSPGPALRVGGCAGVELGRVGGVGRSLGESLEDHTFWGAASLGPRATLRLTPRFALLAEAAAVLPVFQARFVTTDAAGGTRRLYAPASVVTRATLGFEGRF
jgi:hypothetical protein